MVRNGVLHRLIKLLRLYFLREGWECWVFGMEKKPVRIKMPGEYKSCFADPFFFKQGDVIWLFGETINASGKGVLACGKFSDSQWQPFGVILEEPFHLSYPQVFEENGHVYMIPESYDKRKGVVALYEATNFPTGWVRRRTLINKPYVDSTLLQHQGHYYLACCTNELGTAELWHADCLEGPWTLHPQSDNMNQSRRLRRCGGAWLEREGKIYRVAQDCNGVYGKRVFAVQVVKISPTEYIEGSVELLWDQHSFPYRFCHTYNEVTANGQQWVVIDAHHDVFRNLPKAMLAFLRYLMKRFGL